MNWRWIQTSRAELVFGINYTAMSPTTQSLRDHFATTPLFQDVIDALENIQSDIGLRERKRVRHKEARYMIEDGKLWRNAYMSSGEERVCYKRGSSRTGVART